MLDLIWTRTLLVALPCLTQVGSDVQRILAELKDYRTFHEAKSELASCPPAEVMPALEEFLEDDVVQELHWIRIGVYESARKLAFDEVSRTTGYPEFFIAGLADEDSSVRNVCIQALETSPPDDRSVVAGFVVELLRDEDFMNRDAAARCLGNLGPSARMALPELSRCLADPVDEERGFWEKVREAHPVDGILGDVEARFRTNSALARIQVARDLTIDLDVYPRLDERGRSASSLALGSAFLESLIGSAEYTELGTETRARIIRWLREGLCSGLLTDKSATDKGAKECIVYSLCCMVAKWRTSDPTSAALARELLLDYSTWEDDDELLTQVEACLSALGG